jgi:LPXTG-site transpeptidase (sortase) family protein
MLAGVVVLLYVGGLYANAEYQRYAARGDSDIPVPPVVVAVEAPRIEAAAPEPAPFIVPILNAFGDENSIQGQVVSRIPDPSSANHRSLVARVSIPSIGVDSKVVEVGWDVEKLKNGQAVAIWQVAKYAVGQHRGSANPGEGGNVVLAGHVGGYGKVFKDLFYVNPGDQIILYSNGQQYLYTVEQRLVVTEEGVSSETQAVNAALIAPTDHEVVTLVTCWPPSGPHKFSQRIIVRAVPFAPAFETGPQPQNNSVIR